MMLSLLWFSLINTSFASSPCGGSPVGFWTNPDGSRGGWVASTAKVQAGAIIAPKAQVCESAQVKAGAAILGEAKIAGRATILSGAEIDERAKVQGEAKIGGGNTKTRIAGEATVEGAAVVTGTTQIHSRAKVSGKSKVHNAIICQASIIEGFDVIDSDYYCQTEDPEPPHPGEAGMKTLLGIDSDRDGVRDDLEILLNGLLSNTPDKNYKNLRIDFKKISNLKMEQIRHSYSKTKVIEIQKEIEAVNNCIYATEDMETLKNVNGFHEAFMADTKERGEAKGRINKSLAGFVVNISSQKKKACEYRK